MSLKMWSLVVGDNSRMAKKRLCGDQTTRKQKTFMAQGSHKSPQW